MFIKVVSIILFGTNIIWVILRWISRILLNLFISSISRSLVFIVVVAFLNYWGQSLLSLINLTNEHWRSWSRNLLLFLVRYSHYILWLCYARILYWACKCILRIGCLKLWSILLLIRILKIHAWLTRCILLFLNWMSSISKETSAFKLYI